MWPVLRSALFFSILSFATIGTLRAQSYRNQFNLTDDNDQYINPNHDRYYTDGTIVTFTRALPVISNPLLEKKTVDLQIGQQLFNSSSPNITDSTIFDRPFTGYLFVGAGLNWFYKDEDVLKLSAQLGTIGPDALGELVQTDFHKLFKLHVVGAWGPYEVKNEIGLNIDLDYKKLLYRNPANWFDIAFDPEVRLGNTFTNANLGMQLRIGQFGKLFESASTNSRVGMGGGTSKPEFYFIAEPQFTYVAYNATIEGGLFRSDKGATFGIYHLVYVQQLGLQYVSARWSASYTAFIKTREVKSTALGDQWASLNFAYRFGTVK